MIAGKYKNVNPTFFPSEKFVAINKYGDIGCASMKGEGHPLMSVMTSSGPQKYEGKTVYSERR